MGYTANTPPAASLHHELLQADILKRYTYLEVNGSDVIEKFHSQIVRWAMELRIWHDLRTTDHQSLINAHLLFILLSVTTWRRQQMEIFSVLCYWPFVKGIHLSAVDSTHKDQWRGALVFSLMCSWKSVWKYNRDTGDLRRHSTHCDVTIMRRGALVRTDVGIIRYPLSLLRLFPR